MTRKNYSLAEGNNQHKRTQNREIRVLLVVGDETARRKYLEVLGKSDAKFFVTSSFFHLSETIGNQTYHGLILDVFTKMEAIKENKTEVYRLTERFPVAHLKIDVRTEEMQCFYAGMFPGYNILDFIDTQCRNSEPRKIRISARKELHLPVLIYGSAESKHPERAVTQNISPNGCFVISSRHRRTDDEVLLFFPDLTDAARIKAQVRKVVKWGEGRKLPGIGVLFKDLSHSQAKEIAEICLKAGAQDDS